MASHIFPKTGLPPLLFSVVASVSIFYVCAQANAAQNEMITVMNNESPSSGAPGINAKPGKKGRMVFFDGFEYRAERNDKNAANIFKEKGRWNWVKTQQSYGSGNGYLYTVDRIPGYDGRFPGHGSARVLAMELLPAAYKRQTDVFLQYGSKNSPENFIPGDVWFQFWIYPNHYDDPADKEDQLSLFSRKNKFIYPCNGGYPCSTNKWLIEMGSASAAPSDDRLPPGNLFVYIGDSRNGKINYTGGEPWMRSKIGQTNTREYIKVNQWTLVKIHIDTSKTSGNVFEMWLKSMDGNWVKVTEWIGGVTPDFDWVLAPDQAGGHRVLRMPTTFPGGVGAGDVLYDSWIYMDDFAIASSEEALPKY